MPLITETHREEARRVVGSISFLLPDTEAWRSRVEATIATALATAHQSGRDEALEEAAKVADAYADVNIERAGDSILADPVFRGAPLTAAAAEKSEELMIEGCVASSMFHAAQNIATAIRSLKTEGPK